MLTVGGGENRAALPGLNSLAQQARGAKMRLDRNAGKLMKTRQQRDKGAFQAPAASRTIRGVMDLSLKSGNGG